MTIVQDIKIDSKKCMMCNMCVEVCPTMALKKKTKKKYSIRFIKTRCMSCGICQSVCPAGCITLITGHEQDLDDELS